MPAAGNEQCTKPTADCYWLSVWALLSYDCCVGWPRLTLALAVRALASPPLARDLLLVAWRFRARRWFVRPPFLPFPAREYVRWRMYTAYGDENATPPLDDVIRYAKWAARRP